MPVVDAQPPVDEVKAALVEAQADVAALKAKITSLEATAAAGGLTAQQVADLKAVAATLAQLGK